MATMPTRDQGVGHGRYLLVPRTAIFVRDSDSYLLIRRASTKTLWPDKYNGIGGHVDRGEDILSSARREFREETGLEAALWLCGTVVVDAGEKGVGLYVFTGEVIGGLLQASREGSVEWVPLQRIPELPTVEDVPQLLARIHQMRRGDPPFSAFSRYDRSGALQLEFAS